MALKVPGDLRVGLEKGVARIALSIGDARLNEAQWEFLLSLLSVSVRTENRL
jgi:hypothetical protein